MKVKIKLAKDVKIDYNKNVRKCGSRARWVPDPIPQNAESSQDRVTENSNCVILNGAKRSEESWFCAGWEARFFPIWVRMTILSRPEEIWRTHKDIN